MLDIKLISYDLISIVIGWFKQDNLAIYQYQHLETKHEINLYWSYYKRVRLQWA